ncbi:hypothetical protein IFR05_013501 [Cadophora sp. M221]|nr:hypothetical protein IFR05_013501 [Cadophora sp. M221]
MLISLVLATAGTAFAFLGTPMNITNQGCVDQLGFINCQNKIKRGKLAYRDALCATREVELSCFASHCWNKVYQCNYQQHAIKFTGECNPSTPIPYFPAPLNATDDCSCNLGKVYLAISSTVLKGTSCEKEAKNQNVTDSKDVSRNILMGEHCKCCQISGSYASLDAIYPSTNPLHIGFDYIVKMAKDLSLDFNTCEEYILQGSCVTKLNFTESFDGASKPMTYLAAVNLTSFTESNTAMVTNNMGTVSSPPGEGALSPGQVSREVGENYPAGNLAHPRILSSPPLLLQDPWMPI